MAALDLVCIQNYFSFILWAFFCSEGALQKIDFLFCGGGFHAKGVVLRLLKNIEALFFKYVYFILSLTCLKSVLCTAPRKFVNTHLRGRNWH